MGSTVLLVVAVEMGGSVSGNDGIDVQVYQPRLRGETAAHNSSTILYTICAALKHYPQR